MNQKWLNELIAGDTVDHRVFISAACCKTTRKGDPYVCCTAGDRTCHVEAKQWDTGDLPSVPGYFKILGQMSEYNGELSIILNTAPVPVPQPENLGDFHMKSPIPDNLLNARLAALIKSVQHPGLRAVLESVYDPDKEIGTQMRSWPAAQKHHHGYIGGLLEHSLEVADIAVATAHAVNAANAPRAEPELCLDLIIAGSLLHDIGKIGELNDGVAESGYTFGGCLVGHVTLGAVQIARQCAIARKKGMELSTTIEELITHIVVSHHGRSEWGALAAPAFPEAAIIHFADKQSADLFQMRAARETGAGLNGTVYARALESAAGSGGRTILSTPASVLCAPPEAAPPHAVRETAVVYSRPPGRAALRIVRFADEETGRKFDLCELGAAAAGSPIESVPLPDNRIAVDASGLAGTEDDYFMLRIRGESMTGDGIEDGDMVVVKRAERAGPDDLAVTQLDGAAAVKRIRFNGGKVALHSSNPAFRPIPVHDGADLQVQGIVVAIARQQMR